MASSGSSGRSIDAAFTGNESERMAHIKPPRALLVKFARGSMFGEPGNVRRQRRIIMDALAALKTITEPGTIQELPYQWKRPDPDAT